MYPDLETFFPKMLFSIFSLENASQIGLSIPGKSFPLSCQGQRSPNPASGNERLYKDGGQGLCPCSFLRLSSKKVGLPTGVGRAPAAPQGGFEATHPKGPWAPLWFRGHALSKSAQWAGPGRPSQAVAVGGLAVGAVAPGAVGDQAGDVAPLSRGTASPVVRFLAHRAVLQPASCRAV